MLIRIAIAVLILCGVAFAQSPQNQTRIEQPATQDSNNKGAEQQPKSALPPIVVNVNPTPKTDAERNEEADDRRKKAETDTKLAEYTGELAFFTKGLFVATVILAIATFGLLIAAFRQSRDMKASVAVAQATAEAAKQSAETAEKDLFAAHRHLITITDLQLVEAGGFEAGPHIVFGLRNSGKGIAIVNKVGVTIQTIENLGLRQQERIGFASSDFNGAIESGETNGGNRLSSALIGLREWNVIREGKMALYVNFEVLSQDIFHNPINQKFPFVYNLRTFAFERTAAIWRETTKNENKGT
jgi:hypothetical protein